FDPQQLRQLQARWHAAPPDGLAEDLALGLAARDAVPGMPPPLPPREARMAVAPAAVSGQVAAPAEDDYRQAHGLVENLDPELRALARQREAAMPLLLARVLDADAAVAARQLQEVAARCGEAVAARTRQLRQERLQALHPALSLPLAALAFPVLRQQPRPQLDAFLGAVEIGRATCRGWTGSAAAD